MNIFLGVLCLYLTVGIVAWGLAYVHFSKKSSNMAMLSSVVVGITWVYGLVTYIKHRRSRSTR